MWLFKIMTMAVRQISRGILLNGLVLLFLVKTEVDLMPTKGLVRTNMDSGISEGLFVAKSQSIGSPRRGPAGWSWLHLRIIR